MCSNTFWDVDELGKGCQGVGVEEAHIIGFYMLRLLIGGWGVSPTGKSISVSVRACVRALWM